MNDNLYDLYIDYLLSSFEQVAEIGLSDLGSVKKQPDHFGEIL